MDVMKAGDRDAVNESLSVATEIADRLSTSIEGGEEGLREGFPESLFDRCSWFYAICREHLFRDHTDVIARALFAPEKVTAVQSAGLVYSPEAGLHVVEVGCGPGFYASRLAEEYPAIRTTGIDLCERLLERAKRRAMHRGLANCTFHRGDAHALPSMLGRVDAIVVSRLFLVVEDREAVVKEIFRVLRPGGRCFIAEPLSGFRTRVPLACMRLLSKFPRRPTVGYREPQQAAVLSKADFSRLVASEPWGSIRFEYDGRYQYAVCRKGWPDEDGQVQSADGVRTDDWIRSTF